MRGPDEDEEGDEDEDEDGQLGPEVTGERGPSHREDPARSWVTVMNGEYRWYKLCHNGYSRRVGVRAGSWPSWSGSPPGASSAPS
jgi:hypothetical protein